MMNFCIIPSLAFTRQMPILLKLVACMIHLVFICIHSDNAFAKSNNILLGKKTTYSIEPNYSLSIGNDGYDLTNGEVYVTMPQNKLKSPWTSKDTVTWKMNRKQGVKISFDLESIQAINRVSISANSGDGDVVLPLAAYVYVSHDGEKWNYLGNLINEYVDQTEGRVSHVYSVDGLNASGRYLAIYVAASGFYMNLDEIEAYGGGVNPKNMSHKYELVYSILDDVNKRLSLARQKMTTLSFIQYANKAIEADNSASYIKYWTALNMLKKQVIGQLEELDETDEEFGIPYTSIDREVASLVGEYFNSKLKGEALIWSAENAMWSNRTSPFVRPHKQPIGNLVLNMSKDEIEQTAFNISNNTAKKQKFIISIDSVTKNSQYNWPKNKIDMRIATHVVGANFRLYDDALQRFDNKNIEIEPGMTRQIWLFFDSHNVEEGVYNGKVVVRKMGSQSEDTLDVKIKVYPFILDNSVSYRSMSWAYFSQGRNGHKFKEESAAELKRAHNTVQVILHEQVPWPRVDPRNNRFMVPMQLDFEKLDEMLDIRPEVDLWLIWPTMKYKQRRMLNYFRADNPSKPGSLEHQQFVKEWIRLIRNYMNKRGYTNDQFAFYWFDEATDKIGFEDVVVPFSRLAKEVDASLMIFGTHSVSPKMLRKHLDAIDIHCIPTGQFNKNRDYARFFKENPYEIAWQYRVDGGKARDPINDYRVYHTDAFLNGISGSAFWTWIGEGGQWKDPLSLFPSYGMVYLGKKGLVTSKRREAWREGIEDVALWSAFKNHILHNSGGQENNFFSELEKIVRKARSITGYGVAYLNLVDKKVEVLEVLDN